MKVFLMFCFHVLFIFSCEIFVLGYIDEVFLGEHCFGF